MSDTHHTDEGLYVRHGVPSLAAPTAADSGVAPHGKGRTRGSASHVSTRSPAHGASGRRRASRSDAPALSITFGEGMSDDEIVDHFARLLLAVSSDRPAIAHSPGASSSRVGDEDVFDE